MLNKVKSSMSQGLVRVVDRFSSGKKTLLILVILFTNCVLFGQVHETNLKGKMGISFYGGVNIPANGNISSDISRSEFIKPGPHLGFGVSYFITKNIGVEAVFNYDLNFNKDKFNSHNGNQPSVAVNSFSVNGIYNFGNLLNSARLLPYLRAGIGSYEWRHLDDAPWREGNVLFINGCEQKASSFGFNIGAGADYAFEKNFTVGLVLDYNMYFPKDVNKYGKDFGTQGSFTPQLKISYYLPIN